MERGFPSLLQLFKSSPSEQQTSIGYDLLPMQPLAPSDSRSALPLDNEEFKDSSSKIPRDSSWDLERSTSAHVVPASEHSAPLHRNLKARHITMIAIGKFAFAVDWQVVC